MRAYTITITPDDAADATTTLRLESSRYGVRITDVHLHAAEGLRGGRVPSVDFDLLLRAVNPSSPQPLEVAGSPEPAGEPVASDVVGGSATAVETVRLPEEAVEAPAAGRPAVGADVAVPGSAAGDPTADAGTATGRPRRSRTGTAKVTGTKTTGTKTTGTKSSGTTKAVAAKPAGRGTSTRRSAGTRKAKATAGGEAAPAVSARKAGTRRASATASGSAGKGRTAGANRTGRAYRRMPADFADLYNQVGTAAAIADHYQVPRHTAHGWIRRLRDHAATPSAG